MAKAGSTDSPRGTLEARPGTKKENCSKAKGHVAVRTTTDTFHGLQVAAVAFLTVVSSDDDNESVQTLSEISTERPSGFTQHFKTKIKSDATLGYKCSIESSMADVNITCTPTSDDLSLSNSLC